jgi:hypothetical protein
MKPSWWEHGQEFVKRHILRRSQLAAVTIQIRKNQSASKSDRVPVYAPFLPQAPPAILSVNQRQWNLHQITSVLLVFATKFLHERTNKNQRTSGASMSTTTNTLLQPITTRASALLSTGRALVILLALNAIPLLLLPIFIGVSFFSAHPLDRVHLVVIALGAMIQAQLFLLAFWMAFGAWPQQWRSLSIFAITIACGLYFGLTYAAVAIISLPQARERDAWLMMFVVIVLSPIIASGLLWMLNAIFIIPAWCCGYEINLHSEALPTRQPKRSFTIPQLIIWTAQVALPLGSLNIFLTLTEDRAAALRMISPLLLVLISGTPLAIVLLKRQLSPTLVVIASIWCLIIAAAIGAQPPSQGYAALWPTVFIYALTIAANLIALRKLNFCWHPRAA